MDFFYYFCDSISLLELNALVKNTPRPKIFPIENDAGPSIWRIISSLIFCLLLGAGVIFALRRKLPFANLYNKPGDQRLRLLEQLSLTPQRSVYLISLDEEEYLLVFSHQGTSILPVKFAISETSVSEAGNQ
jgi:flagellar biogenesis protein FliO